jgi:single-strand DNA-binding protein
MNNVNLIGRLTATPELKQTPNGKSVCNFSVAVERKFKDTDGNAIVDFIDCVAWNSQADFLCKWFDKGVRVGVTGELQTRRYEKDGQTHKITEMLVNTVEFADGKRETNSSAGSNTNIPETNTFAPVESDGFIPISADDNLPFN